MASVYLTLAWLLARHQNGVYSLACDAEASQHYGISEYGIGMRVWRVRCYMAGFSGR